MKLDFIIINYYNNYFAIISFDSTMKLSFWKREIAKKDREIIEIPILNLKED